MLVRLHARCHVPETPYVYRMGVPVPTDGFIDVDLPKAQVAELQADPWIDVLTEKEQKAEAKVAADAETEQQASAAADAAAAQQQVDDQSAPSGPVD